MLKASKKQAFKSRGLLNMSQNQRPITTHHQWDSPVVKNQHIQTHMDTSIDTNKNVGFFRLNREHRYNTLTSNFLRQIKRGLNTLDREDSAKMIFMHPFKGEHFSNGTDFRSLLFHKKEGNMDAVTQYLTDLYDLQTMTGKINKPLVAIAPGHSFNSGAAWLQSTGLPVCTPSSRVAFNDVTFGFVPHGGSSYYLTRLPGELGTFLAITGQPIFSSDAIYAKLADQLVHTAESSALDIVEIMQAMDLPLTTAYQETNKFKDDSWQPFMGLRKSLDDQFRQEAIVMMRKKHKNLILEEFVEPKDKIPSLTAESEYEYNRLFDQYHRTNHDQQSRDSGYLEFGKGMFKNYYQQMMDHIMTYIGHKYSHSGNVSKHFQAIDRCFYANSMEEIIENLKKENTVFANQCLKKINQNSMLSMKITLQMLRKAKFLDYKACLQQEINVALNKLTHSEFDTGVQEILLKPSLPGADLSHVFANNRDQISADEVNSFFAPNQLAENVQLDVVEKAMLPTRFYFREFSDQVRLFINESSTPQAHVRQFFDTELKEALKSKGIDLRDRAMTIESARNALYSVELRNRLQSTQEERIKQIVSDDVLRNQYQSSIEEEISKLKKNKGEAFYKLVNDKVQDVFKKAYIDRLRTIYHKSEEAHGLEKRRMLIRLKKFLMHNRIISYQNEELTRTMKQLSSMPFKEIHLTEQWDKTFLDQDHPELQRSVLYHISKAIGKVNIAPLEMARQYLTNPKAQDQMTLYTFDKDELLKLRKDILENPEKYQLILSQESGIYTDKDERFDKPARKLAEYEYWYRVFNRGECPYYDTLPNYKFYQAYKEFMENMELKSVDTLRLVVQRLLSDFQNLDGINHVDTYSGPKEKETKRQALTRLLETFNHYKAPPNSVPEKDKSIFIKSQSVVTAFRTPVETKKLLESILEKDPQLRELLPSASEDGKWTERNTIIKGLREELVGELYKTVEFVLLNVNSDVKGISKDDLQKRLAEVTSATRQHKEGNNLAQLRLIDSYLNQVNGEQTLKQAVQLAKPYFLTTIKTRINEEIAKVKKSLQSSDVLNNLFFHYMARVKFPVLFESEIIEKLQYWNEDRDRAKLSDEFFPTESASFTMKQLLKAQGQVDFPETSSLEDKEKALEFIVEQGQRAIKSLQEQTEAIEQSYRDKSQANRDKVIKETAYDPEKPIKEVNRWPAIRMENYDYTDHNSIMDMVLKYNHLQDYLNRNAQAIQDTIETSQQLKIISSAICDLGMDMQVIFRYSVSHLEYLDKDYELEMRNMFGGNPSVNWEAFGQYCGFLSNMLAEVELCEKSFEGQRDLELIQKYMAEHMDQDPKKSLRDESLFKLLVSQRDPRKFGNHVKQYDLREEIADFQKLQSRIETVRKQKENVRLLLRTAPQDVIERVQPVLDSESVYLNYPRIEKLLQDRRYDIILKPANLIDKEQLIQGMATDQNLQKVLLNYRSIPLDVVSLAEAHQSVENLPSNLAVNKNLKTNIGLVLDFISSELQYVSHERRSQMTLHEFLTQHPQLNASSLQDFGSDMLRRRLEKVLGKIEDINEADVVDWELGQGGVRTNPVMHVLIEEDVKSAAERGMKVDMKKYAMNIKDMTEDSPNMNTKKILHVDEASGELEAESELTYHYKVALADAKDLTKLRSEFTHIKNYYENKIMQIYVMPEVDMQELEILIQTYTQMRLQDCMLNKTFSEKIRSNDGHIYLKMLNEAVISELGLTEYPGTRELSYGRMQPFQLNNYDVEAKYDLADVNNEKAIGYDNLEKRVATQGDGLKNRDLAHETVFDKLVAEYFLNKRSDYKNTTHMMNELAMHLDKTQFPEGHPLHKINARKEVPTGYYPGQGEAPLPYHRLLQTAEKHRLPQIKASDFTELAELDIITQQALKNGKNGLSEYLRDNVLQDKDLEKIPAYFDYLDVRKPASKWVEDNLGNLVQEIFDVRSRAEKTLTRNELYAYDKNLIKHLEISKLLPQLKDQAKDQFDSMLQLKQALEMSFEGEVENQEVQGMKTQNKQTDENKAIKNEDAFFKYTAYAGSLEKKRREDRAAIQRDDEIAFGVDKFEPFYLTLLERDLKLPPRPVNPEDYTKTKRVDPYDKGFRTTPEREADFFNELPKFKENKKEQIERNQLFFVLEQFFADTKQKEAENKPLDKAQQTILEYFKETENTYFFDKNKIL